MSKVYFISDLHFGHKKITEFGGDLRTGNSWEENMEAIIDNWNNTVTKRDIVYVLGDVAFNKQGFDSLGRTYCLICHTVSVLV